MSSRRVSTAVVMNSSGLGGHVARKRGRMWQNGSSLLPFYLRAASSLSLMLFFLCCCCFAPTHQPTQCEPEENKSVAATRGQKSVQKSHICGQKKDVKFTLKLSTAISRSAIQVFPTLYSVFPQSFPISFILNIMSLFPPLAFLVRRDEPKPAVQI